MFVLVWTKEYLSELVVRRGTYICWQLTRETHDLFPRFDQLTFKASDFIRLSLLLGGWAIHRATAWHQWYLAAMHCASNSCGKTRGISLVSVGARLALSSKLPSSFFFGYVSLWLALCVGERSPVKPRDGVGCGLVGWLHATVPPCALTGRQ